MKRRLPERPPGKLPWASIGALVLGLAVFAGLAHWTMASWSPLQKHYFWRYLGVSQLPTFSSRQPLVYMIGKGVPARRVTNADERDAGLLSLLRQGLIRTEVRAERGKNRDVAEWWRTNIYEGRTASEKVYEVAGRWWAGAAAFAAGLVFALPRDLARRRKRREGWLIRGPEFVTSQEFMRLTIPRGAPWGIWFPNEDEQAGGPKVSVAIAKDREPMHLLVMGDSGSGKSTLLRWVLAQLYKRGDAAVIYDPKQEFAKDFYCAERGDIILNPLDARMPHWSPGDEVVHDAEALAIAASLVKEQNRENPFFVEGPRRLLAHLLTFRPTTAQLLAWLRDPAEIDRRVRGTELAALIEPSAAQQRAGILSTLGLSIDALRLLPPKQETTSTWSAVEWAKKRQGWIFLTGEPTTREALRLLQTHWLDVLILRLMNTPMADEGQGRVWFVLDELASLNKIPQLHTALTENRKSGNPVVIGFQGRSQLEARYGRDAEVMMSQPLTKIFLRTSEPEAAEWISKAIGEQEIDRERKSHTQGEFPHRRSSHGTQTERVIRRAVLASEVAGLPVSRGYLKHENYIVRMLVPPLTGAPISEGFVPRPQRGTELGGGRQSAPPHPIPIFE